MTNLEKAYFSKFTLSRLKALRKVISKAQKQGHGDGFVYRTWIQKGNKKTIIVINRRKIDAAIKERENQ